MPADKIPETQPVPQQISPAVVSEDGSEPGALVRRAAAREDANLADDYREFFARRKPRGATDADAKS